MQPCSPVAPLGGCGAWGNMTVGYGVGASPHHIGPEYGFSFVVRKVLLPTVSQKCDWSIWRESKPTLESGSTESLFLLESFLALLNSLLNRIVCFIEWNLVSWETLFARFSVDYFISIVHLKLIEFEFSHHKYQHRWTTLSRRTSWSSSGRMGARALLGTGGLRRAQSTTKQRQPELCDLSLSLSLSFPFCLDVDIYFPLCVSLDIFSFLPSISF